MSLSNIVKAAVLASTLASTGCITVEIRGRAGDSSQSRPVQTYDDPYRLNSCGVPRFQQEPSYVEPKYRRDLCR